MQKLFYISFRTVLFASLDRMNYNTVKPVTEETKMKKINGPFISLTNLSALSKTEFFTVPNNSIFTGYTIFFSFEISP